MNILINAISVVEGGSLIVLKKLLNAMSEINPEINWYVAATKKTLDQISTKKNIFLLDYNVNKNPIFLFFWYEILLPRLVKKLKISLLFSQTNYLPRRKVECPTLLLVQHAGHFSSAFQEVLYENMPGFTHVFLWKRKNEWVFNSIKRASCVTVQTNALAEAIQKKLNIFPKKISVISHGCGIFDEPVTCIKTFPKNRPWRIGYITKFGVQKNFITAIKAMACLKEKNISFKFILTLNDQDPKTKQIFNDIKLHHVEDEVENYGELHSEEEIKSLYNSLDIFIFPSFCESFGFPVVEAMAAGLPLIAADIPSNREIADFAGTFVSPCDEIQLANKIQFFIENEKAFIEVSMRSIERANLFSWKVKAEHLLERISALAQK